MCAHLIIIEINLHMTKLLLHFFNLKQNKLKNGNHKTMFRCCS